jgi:chemotaxis protein MotB
VAPDNAAANLNLSLLKAGQVQIKQFEEGITITMANDILFPEGGWKIHRGGRETIDKIIVYLKGRKGLAVEVYGFTDNSPIGPLLRIQFSTNRELSLAQAVDVVSYMDNIAIRGFPLSVEAPLSYDASGLVLSICVILRPGAV